VAHDPIRYLATNHHLAELIQRIAVPDVSFRKPNILLARKHYEDFLKQLDSYDILNASDAKLLEAYNEDKANFSTANTRDAAARRDAKIARFREEKELKRKLEVRAIFTFSHSRSTSELSRISL
jgi:immunoglobulin-binding protein 1